MHFVHVAQASDLPAGQKTKVSVEGREICLVNTGDAFFALDNTCPHMGGSLADGALIGNRIVCPRHGSVFDVTNGKALKRGRMLLIPVNIHDIQSYPVKTAGDDILIGIE